MTAHLAHPSANARQLMSLKPASRHSSSETASQFAGVSTLLEKVLASLVKIQGSPDTMDTKEESSMKQGSSMNGSKPQLKTGYTDKNGNVVSDTKTFHFLKKELSFFITPDLPFRLPPCEPRREGNHHEDLLSVPAGSIFDSVSFTDESCLPEERIAYAKFEPTTKDGKIGISFTNSEGEDVQKQDIHTWYTDDELQDLGQKCIKKYDAAESEDFSLHMAAVTEWVHKRRTWEWEAFCLARQHHAKIHWSNDAQYGEAMAAEKHSSLLSLVEWYGFTDK